MPQTALLFIFTVVTAISCTFHGPLPIVDNEYPMMHYTGLISDELFIPGRPLVIVLPLVEEDSTNQEVGFLVEELHTLGRWPILLYNVSYTMDGYKHTEINKHGSYIILVSGTCEGWEQNCFGVPEQVSGLSGGKLNVSWNPSARFIVLITSNCKHSDSTNLSLSILSHLWTYQISDAVVLFQKSNYLQQNTTDSTQDTYLELHTWHPYENSDRCNPAEGTVPVKVFTVTNNFDIRNQQIFKRCFEKNMQGCPITVHVNFAPPFVNLPKRIWYNDSGYKDVYEDGWDIEMLRIIGNSLNMSLDIQSGGAHVYREGLPSIYIGAYTSLPSMKYAFGESTRNYLTNSFVWYTPCNVKYEKWSRFFNIFSVDMWICFTLSLVLAVITVSCISNYRNKSHFQESKSYSNIFIVTTNIIAVVLSVSVSTQPRSAPLRLFFFSWVCYSVAISTVFQAYLTTFLIEPGYEEPTRTLEQMLKSKRKFGFPQGYEELFPDSSDTIASAILKDAVHCPDEDTCFKWATVYHNISIILDDSFTEYYREFGNWKYENTRPLLCQLEYAVVRNSGFVFLVSNGSHLLELINDVIFRVVEGGIFMQIKKRGFDIQKIEPKFNSLNYGHTYITINIRHLQTAFYLLMLGHVLAVVCFLTEIMWHR